MKKFILNILAYFIPLVLLAYPLDIFISSNIKKSRASAVGEIGVWEDIYNGKVDSDVLIYGSSRAWVQINPILIQDSLGMSCYNLGIDGHSFWLQYLRHLENLEYNKNPKMIIISVGPGSLRQGTDLYNAKQFLPYVGRENIEKYTSSYNGFSFVDYNIPLLRYYGEWKIVAQATFASLNILSSQEYRNRGYRGTDREWTNDLSKAKAKQQSYRINIDSASLELFKKFIIECKEDNIKLIMVYTPIYSEGQRFIENHSEIISLYEEISEKFEIPLFNYLNNDICDNKYFFYNSMHLNKRGSSLLTKTLIKDIKARTHNILYNQCGVK